MRKIWSLPGGVYPPERKSLSNQTAIVDAGIPELLVFPLSQHIGAPAVPVVECGQQVLKGQLIAEAKGLVSVPVHASTSGIVSAIEDRPLAHPSGMSGPCIVITPDGEDRWIELQPIVAPEQASDAQLLEAIRNAGIAGMGGAGFPAAVKLNVSEKQQIDTLIINGTECEPYITADDRLMRERAEQVIGGARLLRQLIKPSRDTIIGVEDNKPEAIAALEKAAQGSAIQIVSFPTKYPSGGEKQLIYILTGREVPSGGLPADIGVVCQNVGTAAAIYQAISQGRPLISRITTVTGEACQRPGNYEVLLGSPIAHLLKLAGFQAERCGRLIMGGPMMGFTLDNTAIPVVKTTNCILASSARELAPEVPAQACIRCASCAEACPVSLLPQQLYWFARGKEHDKLLAHNLMDCIECGACSYSCPSHIPLVQYYRASKAAIRQHQQDHIKSEKAKGRFEARKARIERQEQEKAAKREARLQAAKAKAAQPDRAKTDLVQAAIERAKAKQTAIDPAQAAIEKALARRAGGGAATAEDRDSLQKQLDSAEKKLASAQQKLAEAEASGAATAAAFASAVAKMQEKVAQARAALARFEQNNPTATESAEADPAKAAIAKAMAKRAAAASMSEQEKLQQTIASLQKRLSNSQQKLAAARASGDDSAELLAASVDKLATKLQQAEQALAELN